MTDVMIWSLAAGDSEPIARSLSLLRSMQERTWERDLDPTKQIAVTNASVDGILGSETPRPWACSSIEVITGAISSSVAFLRISWPSSWPSFEYGVTVAVSKRLLEKNQG